MGEAPDEPALGEALHPTPAERDDLADEEHTEVAMVEGAEAEPPGG